MSRNVSTIRKVRRGLVLPALVLLGWWGIFAADLADPRIVASISDVWRYGAQMVGSGELWGDIGASLGRNLLGFAIGVAAGLVLAVLLSLSAWARLAVAPTIDALKNVSAFAWVPLIAIWFGLGEGSRLFFIAFATFFPVYFNAMEGIGGVPRDWLELGRVYGFSRRQAVTRIILPAALPSIFTGLYVGLIMSWMVTLGVEYMLTATRGVGHLLLDGRDNFRMDQVILGVLVVGLIGFALHAIADAVERRVLKWRGSSAAAQVL